MPGRALGNPFKKITGKFHLRFLQTPHVPHARDAGHLFEENSGTFLCSYLYDQNGDVEAVAISDAVSRFKQTPKVNYLNL